MTNFIVIFICLIAGHLCKKVNRFPDNTPHVLNTFIIYISFPALALSQIPKLLGGMIFHSNWWLPISMAWISFAFSYGIISYAGKKLNWSKAKIGALILTAGLGNTSFVGFPLLEALLGPEAIPIGILVDQPGSFLVLSFLGISVAAIFSGTKVTPAFVARRVLTFPPFLTLIFAIAWSLTLGKMFPNVFTSVQPALDKISATLVPLALFSVAFQLQLDTKVLKKRWKPIVLGLMLKLVFLPAFFTLCYMKILGNHDLVTQVVILESAMASMITAAIVSNEFNLDTEIANLMVGISIPLSLITVPLWHYFITL